jgi:hypothetical protein
MEVHATPRGPTNPDRELLRARVRIPQHVVYRDFPAETVVLNLQTERYHGLNPTAGRMLAALEQTSSVKAAATLISERYRKPRIDVERDLCELCGSLLDRGLVEFVESSAG